MYKFGIIFIKSAKLYDGMQNEKLWIAVFVTELPRLGVKNSFVHFHIEGGFFFLLFA